METVWNVILSWRFYSKISWDCLSFHRENMVSLITRMVSMEIVWKQCEK